ncbi:response regulator transcription factor [Nocardioides acrostichi]|uniref:Response regulator transcription factor n=1 Tax=Nocardioides acrostichi TaxID=2784339 RepID=A0A930UWI0_9ACTN|nr:response regulator transcription factor [Nocardioides acrostichi]MBF4162153.1 response regulator transcription factor [Nocardioides acrostichi]
MQPHRALIVDDDPDIASLIEAVLAGLGLETRTALTGADALVIAREFGPDLVTLDLVLPDADGTEVCRRLREFTDAYVIMVTGRTTEVDRLVGLEVGADEYLVKPFSPRELRARATQLLRRPRLGASAAEQPAQETDLGAGLLVEEGTGRARVGEQPVALAPTEQRLLALLVSQPGRAWERVELGREVWAGEFIESDFGLDVQVAGLRRKLRSATDRDVVEVVRGTAYRIVSA